MAKVYITEYVYAGRDTARNSAPLPSEPSSAVQVLDISGGAALSAVLQPTTSIVILTSDVAFSFQVGLAPAAGPSTTRIVSGGYSFAVLPGAATKISVAP